MNAEEYVKMLKAQQEAQNAIMEETEKIHEAQLAAVEQAAVEKVTLMMAKEEVVE